MLRVCIMVYTSSSNGHNITHLRKLFRLYNKIAQIFSLILVLASFCVKYNMSWLCEIKIPLTIMLTAGINTVYLECRMLDINNILICTDTYHTNVYFKNLKRRKGLSLNCSAFISDQFWQSRLFQKF